MKGSAGEVFKAQSHTKDSFHASGRLPAKQQPPEGLLLSPSPGDESDGLGGNAGSSEESRMWLKEAVTSCTCNSAAGREL